MIVFIYFFSQKGIEIPNRSEVENSEVKKPVRYGNKKKHKHPQEKIAETHSGDQSTEQKGF